MTANEIYNTLWRPLRAIVRRGPELAKRSDGSKRMYDGLDLTPRVTEYRASELLAAPFGGLHAVLIGDSNFHLLTIDDCNKLSDRPVVNWAQGGTTPEDWAVLLAAQPRIAEALNRTRCIANLGGNIVLGLAQSGQLTAAKAERVAQTTISAVAFWLPRAWWTTIPPIYAGPLSDFMPVSASTIRKSIGAVNAAIRSEAGGRVIPLDQMVPTIDSGDAVPGVFADLVHWGAPAKGIIIGVLREVIGRL